MCGIVGYVGKDNALPRIISGLKFLEYRGYDSAGVAYVNNNNKIDIKKEVGRISNLEKILNVDKDTNIGIGHTRWATHGVPSLLNSHPHKVGKFTVNFLFLLDRKEKSEFKNFLWSKFKRKECNL